MIWPSAVRVVLHGRILNFKKVWLSPTQSTAWIPIPHLTNHHNKSAVEQCSLDFLNFSLFGLLSRVLISSCLVEWSSAATAYYWASISCIDIMLIILRSFCNIQNLLAIMLSLVAVLLLLKLSDFICMLMLWSNCQFFQIFNMRRDWNLKVIIKPMRMNVR